MNMKATFRTTEQSMKTEFGATQKIDLGNCYTKEEVDEKIADIKVTNGSENWELLQSKDITEEDGEIEELLITFPEGFSKYAVSIVRTAPTVTSNTIMYPYYNTVNGGSDSWKFWDYYEGTNACFMNFVFSYMKLSENRVFKIDGFVKSNGVQGKPNPLTTSGWVERSNALRWNYVRFKTRLNVGSKYRVWGIKE